MPNHCDSSSFPFPFPFPSENLISLSSFISLQLSLSMGPVRLTYLSVSLNLSSISPHSFSILQPWMGILTALAYTRFNAVGPNRSNRLLRLLTDWTIDSLPNPSHCLRTTPSSKFETPRVSCSSHLHRVCCVSACTFSSWSTFCEPPALMTHECMCCSAKRQAPSSRNCTLKSATRSWKRTERCCWSPLVSKTHESRISATWRLAQ